MASSLVLSRNKEGISSTERTGPGFSVFNASADRPAQKNATSDDYSPCFADPALLSVVGFL